MRGHSSYAVLFFYAVLTLAAAAVLRCPALEWGLLIGALGLVLTAELFYSALVKLGEALPAEQATPATHIAMGAVLVASGTALAIGITVFLPKLSALLLP
jgi:diacylglycerol kinase